MWSRFKCKTNVLNGLLHALIRERTCKSCGNLETYCISWDVCMQHMYIGLIWRNYACIPQYLVRVLNELRAYVQGGYNTLYPNSDLSKPGRDFFFLQRYNWTTSWSTLCVKTALKIKPKKRKYDHFYKLVKKQCKSMGYRPCVFVILCIICTTISELCGQTGFSPIWVKKRSLWF